MIRANLPPESWVGHPAKPPPVQAPTTGDLVCIEIQMTDSAENVAGPWRYERLRALATGCAGAGERRAAAPCQIRRSVFADLDLSKRLALKSQVGGHDGR